MLKAESNAHNNEIIFKMICVQNFIIKSYDMISIDVHNC